MFDSIYGKDTFEINRGFAIAQMLTGPMFITGMVIIIVTLIICLSCCIPNTIAACAKCRKKIYGVQQIETH